MQELIIDLQVGHSQLIVMQDMQTTQNLVAMAYTKIHVDYMHTGYQVIQSHQV